MTQQTKTWLKKAGNILGMIFFALLGIALIVAAFYSSILKGLMLTEKDIIDWKLQVTLAFSGIVSLYMTVKFKVIADAVVSFFINKIKGAS